MQRTTFLDTVNAVALFIFIYSALTISWYGTHNRARLQIKCALGGGDSPQHTGINLLLSTSAAWVLLSPPIERRETRPMA